MILSVDDTVSFKLYTPFLIDSCPVLPPVTIQFSFVILYFCPRVLTVFCQPSTHTTSIASVDFAQRPLECKRE